MKKICCILLLAVLACSFSGCSARQNNPDEDLNVASYVPPDAEPDLSPMEETEDIRITVVDISGNPISNLCVELEFISGEEGSYTAGGAMTKSTGTVIREATPANYHVIITDRKQLDYAGTFQRNQMIFPIHVIEGDSNEFSFTWEHPTPNELDLTTADKVVLTFLDVKGSPIEDLWVSMNPINDDNPQWPRQIIPGITDQNGRVYWTNYEIGGFIVVAALFPEDNYKPGVFCKESFTFTATGPDEFTFIWEPEPQMDSNQESSFLGGIKLEQIIELLPLIIPLYILQMVLCIVAVIHVVKHPKYRFGNRIMWVLIVLLVQIIGPIIYFVFGRGEE